jgi:hypothetical protein
MKQKQWPATIDEAVGVVIATLSDEDKATISAMAESELIGLHMGLGAWIRNNLGLWSGNRPLLESTGEPNADDASMVIVEAVWRAAAGNGAEGALNDPAPPPRRHRPGHPDVLAPAGGNLRYGRAAGTPAQPDR